jgi:hypothetical protein
MSASPTNIMIATPCYGGLMNHIYVTSLLKLMTEASTLGMRLTLQVAAHDSLITRSRNGLVQGFLDEPSASHLLFIDADIGFEPEAVARLLVMDEDVVAGMYPIKAVDWAKLERECHPDMDAAALREAGLHFVGVPCTGAAHEEKNHFVTGKYAGTGFMMIKRSALEKMIAAYPESRYRGVQLYGAPKRDDASFYNFFDCMIEPKTGIYLSEDFAFCHRFRAIGGKIWLDTRSRLRHVGAAEFEGNPAVEMIKYGAAREPKSAA